tara:strand:+ start:630 stop:1913 length:1284 start_codon:yes stop_codon:yes gene_type:complete
MNTVTIQIRKPDDSGGYWSTQISSSHIPLRRNITLNNDRSAKDPIHKALTDFFKLALKKTRRYSRYRRSASSVFDFPSSDFNSVINIGSCPIAIGRIGNRLTVNGQKENLSTIACALARVALKAAFEHDAGKLLKALYSALSIPEDVKYCLENKVPFHFYSDFVKTEVRLDCQQISDDEIAIEVSDGVWGTMTLKELEYFCSFYLHNKKRSKKWMFISPELLYERTVGNAPTIANRKVMIEFMKQNRQQDIVESRAKQLVKDMAEKYPNRLKVIYEDNEPITMYVRGKGWDWKLTNNKFKSDIQMVSTFVYSPSITEHAFNEAIQKWDASCAEIDQQNAEYKEMYADTCTEEELTLQSYPEMPVREGTWRGPICIDNMTGGSSLGDQFVARALALLNDTMTVKIVNTIQRYIQCNENEYRVEMDEMQ